MTKIVTIETESLADRSYLVSDGEVVAVIDPQRDIDRVLAVTERLGVRITHVFETHVHIDCVTGGLALARAVGAADVLSATENGDFDHVGVVDEWATGGQLRSYRRATFAELAEEIDRAQVVVLDVRRDAEWSTNHLDGAVHVPLDQLDDRLSEIPDGQVWVHCESGYRAAIAASLLDRAGRRVALIDDDWTSVQHQPDLAVAGPPPSP